VQVPPEYDPYRRYPCVVTLGGGGVTAETQLAWWAGAYSKEANSRLGQATRRGYIVISPDWTRQHQKKYEFSAQEHAAVLYSLRDACRRFSIDTDRVFLSGHSMGGDAAWDIGLAHPDLWAGVIPIGAGTDKYIPRYRENGRRLPMYFVQGELDGDRMATNGKDFDKYFNYSNKYGDYEVMVVEYLGRGHEHFQDEIQRIFAWMELHTRNFFPREFKCVSMRPWDNYFWWIEVDNFPDKGMVMPAAWPPSRGTIPPEVESTILATNKVSVKTSAKRVTVWLSPEMVDFGKRISVNVQGGTSKSPANIKPDSRVLLEDVRTRADRQHPFWAKWEN
jgi:pimeloyl-ACP methyl ester carboxylesterase